MRLNKFLALAFILIFAVTLSACDVTTPSMINTGKIRIKNQMVTKTFDVHNFDEAFANEIAQDVIRNGRSKMTLTLSYFAEDRANRVIAEKSGQIFKQAFKDRGVYNVKIVTVPVDNKNSAGKLVVTYKSLVAEAPEECTRIIGSDGADSMEAVDKYQFGCNTKMTISKMVADPSDLLGKSGSSGVESRRSGATVENYKTGTPNNPMGGYQASNIGTGQ